MYLYASIKIFLINLCYFLIVDGQIAVSNKACGTKFCSPLEYCSPFDKICESCANVCEESHHNFDGNRCRTDCQNYLLAQNNGDLREEVNYLRNIATISLTLTCILLAIIIIIVVINILKWRRKHRLTLSWLRKKLKLQENSKSDRNTTVSVTTISGKPDLRLEIPSPGMQTPSANENTPSTTTTTISRRPTEDNTLDYAYDNPVMVSTPSPVSKPHESAL